MMVHGKFNIIIYMFILKSTITVKIIKPTRHDLNNFICFHFILSDLLLFWKIKH